MRNDNLALLLVSGAMLALAPLAVRAQAPLAPPPPLPITGLPPVPPEVQGPKAQFASTTFEFGKVPVGTVVRATFVLTNVGNAALEITDVRPGCGCTTAGTWDRRVEPGKTTTIPLQLNTANFGGPLLKSAALTCNDPTQPMVTLMIKGEVWKPIDVQPNFVVFNTVNQPTTNDVRVVRVINNTEEVITIEEPASSIPSFKPKLKVVKPGKEFEIEITAVSPLASGTVQGMITAKTSSTNLPLISLTALAIVQPAVVPMPGQVMLPGGPLASLTQSTVAFRNNLPEPITVSNPSVSLSNVAVTLTEVQAGRIYNVVLSFPAGFQLKPGERSDLVVKTSHAQTPLITVPILQMAPMPQPPVGVLAPPPQHPGGVGAPMPLPPGHSVAPPPVPPPGFAVRPPGAMVPPAQRPVRVLPLPPLPPTPPTPPTPTPVPPAQ